jgi:hypothetical protein
MKNHPADSCYAEALRYQPVGSSLALMASEK